MISTLCFLKRIIFVSGPINDSVSSLVTAQLLYLEADNPDKDIAMYINSPGGVVTSGLAIYDTMQYIRPDISHYVSVKPQVWAHFCLLLVQKVKGLLTPCE